MKAVVLYSGGLDSTIALKIVQEWGTEVYPLYVFNKFLSVKALQFGISFYLNSVLLIDSVSTYCSYLPSQ